MIVILRPDATEAQIQHIVNRATKLGLKSNISRGVERTVIGFIGPEDALRVIPLEVFPGVEQVLQVLAPYKLVSREFKKQDTVIKLEYGAVVGGKKIAVMAGPCSVEGYESMLSIAKAVKAMGATILRGGAFKPRTSPYDFQGLGEEGLKILQQVGKQVGICTISEVMDTRQVELVAKYVDVLQIGARNIQNFSLLKEVGASKKPVMLKRGMSTTIKEWLMSAEYLLANGNFEVMLCERGIRTFETATRNTLDINAVAVAKKLTHLPVIVDPSHGTGSWEYVAAGARAGVAAGCDGLIIEVHENPEEALSDGAQSLIPAKFQELMASCKRVAQAVGRDL
ncbi:MAG: 3-deoxy-7-phosphoheptulonate synthase [Candidatus Omnitrophica bacterium]|nr:3-deoxy-7-phosphoheptulonate synthase [Candidatus Omnitrophota bacterium]